RSSILQGMDHLPGNEGAWLVEVGLSQTGGSLVLVPTRSVLALVLFVTLAFEFAPLGEHADNSAWLDPYREPAARLIGEAVGDTFAWRRLSLLTDTIGNRLSGTPQLDRAIEWAMDEMKRDGLENVHAEKAMVPKWVRGVESADVV